MEKKNRIAPPCITLNNCIICQLPVLVTCHSIHANDMHLIRYSIISSFKIISLTIYLYMQVTGGSHEASGPISICHIC
jgi:hypothetical protein